MILIVKAQLSLTRRKSGEFSKISQGVARRDMRDGRGMKTPLKKEKTAGFSK